MARSRSSKERRESAGGGQIIRRSLKYGDPAPLFRTAAPGRRTPNSGRAFEFNVTAPDACLYTLAAARYSNLPTFFMKRFFLLLPLAALVAAANRSLR